MLVENDERTRKGGCCGIKVDCIVAWSEDVRIVRE